MAVYKSITFDNRKKIAALYAKGMSISDISDEVGVALRTLYVELKRGCKKLYTFLLHKLVVYDTIYVV